MKSNCWKFNIVISSSLIKSGKMIIPKKNILLLFLIALTNICFVFSQNRPDECKIYMQDDNLVLENGKIKRLYKWNDGDIMTISIENKETNRIWEIEEPTSDLLIPGIESFPTNTKSRIFDVAETAIIPFHKCIEIIYSVGSLDIKRVLRLYPGSPAIAADYYFRGNVNTHWVWDSSNARQADFKTKENLSHSVGRGNIVSMENLKFSGKHWKLELVALLDNTDRFNSLVNMHQYLSFSPRIYEGNILFAKNLEVGEGIFMLKEAPAPMAQLFYPGGDYITNYGQMTMIGMGLSNEVITPDKWVKGYSSVVGVSGKDEVSHHKASLAYQMAIKKYIPERDDLIMANTWGDGNKDGKISEKFILDELEASKFYGITHFQIDDGWQQGLSEGSVTKTGNNKWDSWEPEDWTPNKKRFPNGFSKVMQSAKEKNIELGLWFNPSKVTDFAAWETDADILINIYKKYRIKYFKIDGMQLANKKSEENFISFLEKIKTGTKGRAIFNLDVTLGKRFGYLYYADYGTIFVENRYTKRYSSPPNYYPFWTLRNFWMLSRYVPAQKLQIEFPNKWNNTTYYAGDRLGPVNYDFGYLFAITMMGQPLAWFEPSNLPDEAKSVAPIIKKYRKHQKAIHEGVILPIGDEPSGNSWTGFQSIANNKGYLLIFRENSESNGTKIKIHLPPSSTLKLNHILGDGVNQKVNTSDRSELTIKLNEQNSFVLYQYELI